MTEAWDIRPLSELLVRERRPVKVMPGVEYPAVSVLKDGRGLGVKAPFVGGQTNYKTLFQVRRGDVVVRTITAFESPVGVAHLEHDATHVSQVFMTYQAGEEVLPAFLELVFGTPAFWDEMRRRVQGTVLRRKTISDVAFGSIPVPVPPRAAQAEIVAFFLDVDRAVDCLRDELDASEQFCGALREQSFRSMSSNAVKRVPFGELTTATRSPLQVAPGEIYVQAGLRSHGRGMFEKPGVTGLDLGSKKMFTLTAGDLVFNVVFAWEGAVGVVPDQMNGMCCSHRFPTFARMDGGPIGYLRHFFLTQEGIAQLGLASPGGAGRNRTLNRARLDQIMIPVPSTARQQAITDGLDAAEHDVASRMAELLALQLLRGRLLAGVLETPLELRNAWTGAAQ